MTSYLELSELPRKLLGFMHVQQASIAAPSLSSSAPADAGTATTSDGAAGVRSESASTHVSPLALVHSFLMSLMHPDKDGRVSRN